MREIKFRGKRIDNGEWVYGDLRQVEEHAYMLDYDFGDNGVSDIVRIFDIAYSVIPETVGQYTGLKDMNGAEIYEGDIVILKTVSRHRSLGCVRWTDFARYEFWHLRQDQGFQLGQRFDETEIIGNIHDNPELLGGAE